MEKEIDIKKLKERIGENLFKTRRGLNLTLIQASSLIEIKRSKLDWL